jgi:hypothetical protein
MKNIKGFINSKLISLFIILVISLFVPAVLHAQTQTKLLFVVTPYQPLQNLDFFFTHSVHPIAYYEQKNTNTPIKIPVFLSIITPEQKEEYLKAGYKPVIVDENAGALEQYSVLYNRNSNQSQLLTNQEYKQQGLELVYPVTEYTTLIKLAPSVTYHNLHIPGLTRFQPRKIFMDLVPPVDRTSPALRTATTVASNKPAIDSEWMLSLFFLIVISVFLYFALKRNKN